MESLRALKTKFDKIYRKLKKEHKLLNKELASIVEFTEQDFSLCTKDIEDQRKKWSESRIRNNYNQTTPFLQQELDDREKHKSEIDAINNAEFISLFKSPRIFAWLIPTLIITIIYVASYFSLFNFERDNTIKIDLWGSFCYFLNFIFSSYLLIRLNNIKYKFKTGEYSHKSIQLFYKLCCYLLGTWVIMYLLLTVLHLGYSIRNNYADVEVDTNYITHIVSYLVMILNSYNSIIMFGVYWITHSGHLSEINKKLKKKFLLFILMFSFFIGLAVVDSLYDLGKMEHILRISYACFVAIVFQLFTSVFLSNIFSYRIRTFTISFIYLYAILIVAVPVNMLNKNIEYTALTNFAVAVFACGKLIIGNYLIKLCEEEKGLSNYFINQKFLDSQNG